MQSEKMLTLQEIFDKATTGLFKQGKPSTRVNRIGRMECVYRGENGCMCAVGILVKDEAYNPAIEGRSVDCINGAGSDYTDDNEAGTAMVQMLKASDIDPDDPMVYDLLVGLQSAHDGVALQDMAPKEMFDQWRGRFSNTGARMGLNLGPMNTAYAEAIAKLDA